MSNRPTLSSSLFLRAALCSFLFATPLLHGENELRVLPVSGAAGSQVTITVELENDFPVLGWSYGVCLPPSDLGVITADLSSPMLALVPEFMEVELPPEGVACAVVISYDPFQTIAPQLGMPILEVTTELLGAPGSQTTVEVCEGIGAPPVDVVIAGPAPPQEVDPVTIPGIVSVDPLVLLPQFVRADCNGDTTVNIADAINILENLFVTGATPACPSACDSNDDGLINIADGISALEALFIGGVIPPPNLCGEDPTADALSCATSPCP